MSCTDLGHPVPTTTRSEDNIVFAALELSRKSWLVATSPPGEAASPAQSRMPEQTQF